MDGRENALQQLHRELREEKDSRRDGRIMEWVHKLELLIQLHWACSVALQAFVSYLVAFLWHESSKDIIIKYNAFARKVGDTTLTEVHRTILLR